MKHLIDAAKLVIERWEHGNLGEAVTELSGALLDIEEANEHQIARARELYSETAEIDDDALLSQADDGVWVQAWVFLAHEEG